MLGVSSNVELTRLALVYADAAVDLKPNDRLRHNAAVKMVIQEMCRRTSMNTRKPKREAPPYLIAPVVRLEEFVMGGPKQSFGRLTPGRNW